MKRVLHVVNRMGYGGIEAFIMNLYRNIDKNKVQFDFAVHTTVKGEYDNEIKKLGGNIYYFTSRRKSIINYYKDWNSFLKKYAINYSSIHMHVSSLTTILPIKLAKKFNIKNRIIHAHSTLQSGILHKLLIAMNKKKIKMYATELIACSTEAGKYVFGKNQFNILHNGINIDKYKYNNTIRYKIRNELKIKDDQLALVHVGRFDYAKNHEFLIDIFKEINKYDSNAILFLIGDGELKNKIKQKVNEFKLTQNVMFLNKREDVNEILQGMDAFIFPSNYEGLPIAMIEAQAAGLHVFASNHISSESKISELVQFIPLEAGAKTWARTILANKNIFKKRKDMERLIKKEGYDIMNSVNKIYKIYMN